MCTCVCVGSLDFFYTTVFCSTLVLNKVGYIQKKLILIDKVKTKQLIVRVLVTVSVSIMETILVDAFSGKIYFHFWLSFSKNGDTVGEY